MKTFIGSYKNNNFIYSSDNEVIKAQLISILNTPIGSRFYYPSYGSRLNEYRFSILNYFTINIIAQEVKNAIELLSGVSLTSLTYDIYKNKINFNIELERMSDTVRINLTVIDGVAS